MKIILSPLAEKQLKKLQKISQILIAQKVRKLREDNFTGSQKLAGYKNVFRVRIGNYRFIYRQFADKIYVIVIAHRKEVYLLLRKLLS